jgi:His-Xaa-Ser system radical SAM maturase HxsC
MTDKFKKGNNDNALFVTSACSNRCIMCCQPPKHDDDSDYLFQKNLVVITSADTDTDYVCITGGEPTLIGDRLFVYMHKIWERMPDAEIHLLTNGRKFSNVDYLTAFVKNVKGNIVLGIPLHSDNPIDHDYIAGAKGSFYETLKGFHNLGLLGFNVELRVILLQQNYQRLPKIAEFISLNLPFVSQVSIMGLEITGYAEKRFREVWIDPMFCTTELARAVASLEQSRIQVRLFNLPLCLLPQQLWEYACRSISDWKQTYLAACEKCKVKEKCCGMFSTSKWYSCFIRPVL